VDHAWLKGPFPPHNRRALTVGGVEDDVPVGHNGIRLVCGVPPPGTHVAELILSATAPHQVGYVTLVVGDLDGVGERAIAEAGIAGFLVRWQQHAGTGSSLVSLRISGFLDTNDL